MRRRSFVTAPLIMYAGSCLASANQNEALSDLAVMFFEDRANPTFGVQLLNPGRLDFSIDSLAHVDDYLDTVRKDKEVEKTWNRVVLRCGAYVGEVVRRNDKRTTWDWIRHEDAARISPKFFASLPERIATVAVLHDGHSGLAFPLAKVEKFLENGREDSVKFFAEVMIAGRK